MRFERKLYVIRKRVEHAVDRAGARRTAAASTSPSLSSQHADLQGHADGRPDRSRCSPISTRSGHRVGARARAPALQHQHVPVLAAGAPVPLHRAQRRDQHAARQHQLDARARRRCCESTLFGDDLQEDPAGHPRGRQRHGDVRQRARVPGDDRALAAARDPDDDPGAVAGARDDEPGAARRSTSTTRR